MRTPRRTGRPAPAALPALLAVLLLAAALLLPAAPAAASGYGRFQHTGRGTAQVGALTARADDPSAIYYNPAGIVELDGLRLAGGLDFNNATDEYSSDTAGGFRADHAIEFPPSLYLTWSDQDRLGNWALGVGVDTPYWYRADWDPVFFPPRFNTRLTELELWQLHPVAAYRLNDSWSVGGGLRYLYGDFTQGYNAEFRVQGTGDRLFPAEVLVDGQASVDGYGFDLGTRYHSDLWGFGAVYRSAVSVDGNGNLERGIRDAPLDDLAAMRLGNALAAAPRAFETSLDLPWEASFGVWFAPYPELRFELDAALAGWSDFEQTYRGRNAGGGAVPRTTIQSGWDDTLSVRLGVEGEVTETFLLSGGVAFEPSPVPDDRVSPAWFRGDATVYAVGASFVYDRLTFDLGFSLHDHDTVTVTGQEPGDLLPVRGSYDSDDKVWSVSARYRF